MKKHHMVKIFLLLCLWVGFGQAGNATIIAETKDEPQSANEETEQHDKLFQFLQDAYRAQMSLGDIERTLPDISKVLNPYFTDEFTKKFIDEKIFKVDGGYILLGSDVLDYFVPAFSYDNHTKVLENEDHIIVYQFWDINEEGPVSWPDHYEGLLLEKSDAGIKISEYIWSETKPEL